jgi:hypothetical protein
MEDLFCPAVEPSQKLFGALRREMDGKVSMLTLAKDLIQVSRGIVL